MMLFVFGLAALAIFSFAPAIFLTAEYVGYEMTKREKQDALTELERKISVAAADFDIAKNRLAGVMQEEFELEKAIETRRAQLARVEAEIAEKTGTSQNLDAEIERGNTVINANSEKIAALAAQEQNLAASAQKLKAIGSALEASIAADREKSAALATEIAAAEQKANSLQAASAEYDALAKKRDFLTNEITEIDARRATAEAELARSRGALTAVQNELATARENLGNVQTETAKARVEGEGLVARMKNLAAEMERLDAEIARMNDKVSQLSDEKAALQKEIRALEKAKADASTRAGDVPATNPPKNKKRKGSKNVFSRSSAPDCARGLRRARRAVYVFSKTLC